MNDTQFEAEPVFDEPVPMAQALESLSGEAERSESAPPPCASTPNTALNQALENIRALDGSIQTLEDLKTMPDAEVFHRHVLRGNSLTDAFRLTHFERLSAKRAEIARQAALSRTVGKRHLAATPTQSAAVQPIPAETLAMYREMHPGLRDEDYRSHYARHNRTSR